jgi:hypothetical protein
VRPHDTGRKTPFTVLMLLPVLLASPCCGHHSSH